MGRNPEKIEILENVIIIYSNGKKDIFEAIHITDEGIHIGRIINNYEFLKGGFIPKNSIKHIFSNGKKIFFKNINNW
jgi:hypothetical protein